MARPFFILVIIFTPLIAMAMERIIDIRRTYVFGDFNNASKIDHAYSQLLLAVKKYKEYIAQEEQLARPSFCAEATQISTWKKWWALKVIESAKTDVDISSFKQILRLRNFYSASEFPNVSWIPEISGWGALLFGLNDSPENRYLNKSSAGQVSWRSNIRSDLEEVYRKVYDFCLTPGKILEVRFHLTTFLTTRLIIDEIDWFLGKIELCISQLDDTVEGCDTEPLKQFRIQSVERVQNYVKLMELSAQEFPEIWCTSYSSRWKSAKLSDEQWSPFYQLSTGSDKTILLKINGGDDQVHIRFGHNPDFTGPYHWVTFDTGSSDEEVSRRPWHNFTISVKRSGISVIGEDNREINTLIDTYKDSRSEYNFNDPRFMSVRVRGAKTRKLLLKTKFRTETVEKTYWCSGWVDGPNSFNSLNSLIYPVNKFYSATPKPLVDEAKILSWNATLHGCPGKQLVIWNSKEDFPHRPVMLGEDEFHWPNIFCQFTIDDVIHYGILTDYFSKCKVNRPDGNFESIESEEFQYLAYK